MLKMAGNLFLLDFSTKQTVLNWTPMKEVQAAAPIIAT
jgi:hypothetical protein